MYSMMDIYVVCGAVPCQGLTREYHILGPCQVPLEVAPALLSVC